MLWALGGTDIRHDSFAEAFAVVERQSELQISVANAGSNPLNCTAYPDLSGLVSQCLKGAC